MKTFLPLLLIFGIGIGSCSPQKRLNRIIKNNPGLLQTRDTIIMRDTITLSIPSVKIDTTLHLKNAKDTVVLKQDFVIVKTFIKGDSIYIEAKTEPITQTKIIEKRIPVDRFVVEEKHPWGYFIWLGLIIVIQWFVIWYLTKK